MTPLRPAVFLDRDGTLNVDRCYITSPDQLELLPGVAAAVQLLRSAGFACVVVTNQSAVGRGMMTDADLQCVHAELTRQLAQEGVTLDAIYACTGGPGDHPDRKPAPGLLLRAAAELSLDLERSWMIGDTLRDMHAGRSAGCQGCILVRTGQAIDEAASSAFVIVDDLLAAARHVVASVSTISS